jgi:hypothetical protein
LVVCMFWSEPLRLSRELRTGSVATVLIGGLVSSTLLTLFVLPALYAFLGGESRLTREDLGLNRQPPLADVEQAAE